MFDIRPPWWFQFSLITYYDLRCLPIQSGGYAADPPFGLLVPSRAPRKETYPQVCLNGCLKGYPRDRSRVMELLIGGEFLSYPSLISQLKKGYPYRHPLGYVSFLGFRLRSFGLVKGTGHFLGPLSDSVLRIDNS